MSDYLFKICDFAPMKSVDPKFQVEVSEAVASNNHSFFKKLARLSGLSYGIKIWTDFSFALSQSTRPRV